MAGGGIKINNIKISGGADGATFTPSVDTAGNLSWTNDKGYENPPTVNIKGEKGEQGEQGRQGLRGLRGVQGEAGKDGKDGTIITANGEEQSTWDADTKADVYEVESVREETNMLWDEVFGIYGDLNHASTRIGKVEQDTKLVKEALFQKGIIARAEVEQAYTSRVTADGANIVDGQKTPVTMIKGSTVRCENLWDIDRTLKSDVLVKNADGSYTLTKTANGRIISFYFDKPIPANTTVTFSVKWTSNFGYTAFTANAFFEDGTETWLNLNNNYTSLTRTLDKPIRGFYIYVVGTVENGSSFTFTEPMFNIGQPLPYQPYFTGLKHAKIDSIVSTGANLLDISKFVGGMLVDNGDGTYTITNVNGNRFAKNWELDTPISGGEMYFKADIIEKSEGADITIAFTDEDGRRQTASFNKGSTYTPVLANKQIKKVEFYLGVGTPVGGYVKFRNLSATRSPLGANVEYTPFTQEIYQLPETLELPKFDRFNPQTGEITRATSERLVLTGADSERWYFEKMEKHYRAALENAYSFDMTLPNKMVSNLFSNVNSYPDYKTPYIGGSALAPRMWVYLPLDWGITTLDEWKAFLQAQAEAGKPLIVEYQLATPTVEKLEYASKLYTAYNQGNETAVLENEEFGAIPTITNEYIVVL